MCSSISPDDARIPPLPPAPAPLSLPDELWRELAARYAEPQRHYHGASHIAAVLGHFDELQRTANWRNPTDVYFALLAHDAIYDPRRKDNELRSAGLARDLIERFELKTAVDPSSVASLIELTASHATLSPNDVPDADTALFLDCDLAVLAAGWNAYVEYERGIAAEYAQCWPAVLYRFGRRKFLESMLRKERIFMSRHFHQRCDGAARRNMTRWLELRGGEPVTLQSNAATPKANLGSRI